MALQRIDGTSRIHDFDLNYPFVECINGGDCNSDVNGISASISMSSNHQTSNQQEDNISQEDNNVRIKNEPTTNAQPPTRPSRELGNNKKKLIVQDIIFISKDGSLPQGSIKAQTIKWNVSRWTILRLWKKAKNELALGIVIDVKCKKKGKVGRKPKVTDMELLRVIPIEKRTTVREIASALGIRNLTVYRLMKLGIIRSHTNSIKTKLSPDQKHKRMHFILTQIIPSSVHMLSRFGLIYNVIHIDEKWFYMSKGTQRFYLFHSDIQHEIEPYRCVQNKHFIGKVMFLAAIARPQKDVDGQVVWDGKICIFPFTEDYVAVKSSSNQHAGTIEQRAIIRVTRDVIRKKNSLRKYFLQLGESGLLMSIQFKEFPKDVKELVKVVEDAFDTYDPTLINYTCLQYQLSMLKVLKVEGGNKYKGPHIGKQRLDRLSLLPLQIKVSVEIIESKKQILEDSIIDLNVTLQEEH